MNLECTFVINIQKDQVQAIKTFFYGLTQPQNKFCFILFSCIVKLKYLHSCHFLVACKKTES